MQMKDAVSQMDIDRAAFPKRFAEEINMVLKTLDSKEPMVQNTVVGLWIQIRYSDPSAPR